MISASLVPDPAAAPRADLRIAVALFNDTGNQPHVGCLAVSQAHRRMLRRAGAFVRHAFFECDLHHLGTGSLKEGIRAALASPELRRAFAETDVVVVNGEGTIHHRQGRHLVAVLGAAQRLGLPTFLVNAVLQDVDDAREVLAALTDCTVRDRRSACYMRELGVAHRLVPDSFFEAAFSTQRRHDFAGRVVVTDVHPARAHELADALGALRACWRGRTVEYPLEAAERAVDWQHAVADVRGADAVVTGRHHGVCLALRAGVPFVALPSNTWKVEGLIDMLDGYPADAADPDRSLAARLEAARAARPWFQDAARRLTAGRPLATFDRLTSRLWTPRPPIRSAGQVHDDVVEIAAAFAQPGLPVLHCGSGDGSLVAALLGRAIDAIGVDVSRCALGSRFAAGRLHGGTPARLPFGDSRFGLVVVSAEWLEHLEEDELPEAIREIVRVARGVLLVETTGRPFRSRYAAGLRRDRGWWEERLFRSGLRRYTRSLAVGEHASVARGGTLLLMEKCPAHSAALEPSGGSRRDILRDTGSEADATLARYELSRAWIRPGDLVVDAGCGSGGGTALLWDGSEAGAVIGLGADPDAVDYARRVFSTGRSGLEFRMATPDLLGGLPDGSADCIVCLGGRESPSDLRALVAQASRVLKPGGRFLCAVPAGPAGGVGGCTPARLAEVVSTALLVDEIYAQSAGADEATREDGIQLRNIGWPDAPHDDPGGVAVLLVSALKDPLGASAIPYAETVFPPPSGRVPNAIAFARDYVNPWAVHALVMGSFRVRSPRLLRDLAARWLSSSPCDSADAGAALCILAYRALTEPDDPAGLLARIAEYRALAPGNPHVRRWQVSLAFVEGHLRMRRGELRAAEEVFRACAASEATAFTPHLETKTTEAAWYAGLLAQRRGDPAAAASAWALAFRALDRLRATPVEEWLVSPDRPASFEHGDGLREIAMAVDNAALAAGGIRSLADAGAGWRPGPQAAARNFQQAVGSVLREVQRRGGHIASLTADHDAVAARWRAAAGALHEAQQQILALSAQTHAGRAVTPRSRAEVLAFRRILRGRMQRVVIAGADDSGRRIWEALASGGGANVIAFLDDDARRQERPFLGLNVYPIDRAPLLAADAVAVSERVAQQTAAHLRRLGLGDLAVVPFPVELDDEALAALAAERFPDPLRAMLSESEVPGAFEAGIFGTGAAGMKVWEALADLDEARVAWFADNDPARHGRTILWADVIAPAAIPASRFDVVIVGSMSRDPIRDQLRLLGVPEERILTPCVTGTVEVLRSDLALALGRIQEVRR